MISGVKEPFLLGRGVYGGRVELEVAGEVVVVDVVLEAKDVVMGLEFGVESELVVLRLFF